MYKVFTISSGDVKEGADVVDFTFRNGEITIQALVVGEEGRGREKGVLSISGAKADETLMAASVAETRSGKPKLFAARAAKSDKKAIVVFRTQIGYRGGNAHTGDNLDACFKLDYSGRDGASILGLKTKERYSRDEAKELSPKLMAAKYPDDDGWTEFAGFDERVQRADFPGEILVTGVIAQGAAGRAGSGKQVIALIPKGVVFRTSYGGRLYGSPPEHFYQFDGENIVSLTADEREMADLF